jgi:SulP family sulfate permease
MAAPGGASSHAPSRGEDLEPKLLSIVRAGYRSADFRADALAGLTVAIVALPLSMAIAIASGLPPERGLYAAIFGGFLVSALGGSRHQIGGPAGAFIVLVASIVERHGVDGLIIATAMAGVIMIAIGVLRLGTYIRYVPFPVVVGFTAGIATIIFASQIRELLGLKLDREPAELLAKLAALWTALPTIDPRAVLISALSIAIILGLRRYRPAWPGLLIAVTLAAVAVAMFKLDVATIGSRFGGIPQTLPWPSLPAVDLARLQALLPDAIAIALLGSIESLLSALVADTMAGGRHRSNAELVGQGVANIGSVAMGGMTVTGTVARTATNVRAGGRTPVAGMLHAVYLLAFVMIAAPLASHIPLAALAGVLAIVAWNMAEIGTVVALLRASRGDAAMVLVTFVLTIAVDLTIAILAGIAIGALVVLKRLADAAEVEGRAVDVEPSADSMSSGRPIAGGTVVYRMSGALFFGVTARLGRTLDRSGGQAKRIVFDFRDVTVIDSSATAILHDFVERQARGGAKVVFAGTTPAVRHQLIRAGLRRPVVRYVKAPSAPAAQGPVD